VILLDVNSLVYAHDVRSAHHGAAKEWIDGQLNGPGLVGFPWETVSAFLRIVTHPRIYERPTPLANAWQQMRDWLDREVAWIPLPTERHIHVFEELLLQPGARANLVPDAHLAALAIEHGLILCSADNGFARFPRLRWMNPLTP
jgi:toxin-antitoxin system PIN domain toxin